ncbi:hypothetical protein NSQ29_04885 [Paenibacillus sp. FSL F4-0236]|uniref:hypothetical protein n=1 Tax=Paenibacillus sp. FSL F4-0236 TaxID=2954731 RepID=UPI0030F518ED
MKRHVQILFISCILFVLVGCSNELKEAKENANAGMHIYLSSQQDLEGDNKIEIGLKWLFGILDDTDIPKEKMDDELTEIREEVMNILSTTYMITDEEVHNISSTKDEDQRSSEIEKISRIIAEDMNQK